MAKRKNIRGRRITIEKDMTWMERKMQWRMREIGQEEGRQGNRARVSYGKIEINGRTWWWEEQRETLRDLRGNERKDKGRGGIEKECDNDRREEEERERGRVGK